MPGGGDAESDLIAKKAGRLRLMIPYKVCQAVIASAAKQSDAPWRIILSKSKDPST